ncbi:DNA adenine methyltransferase YhdJ, partial [termite gut metagenome]
ESFMNVNRVYNEDCTIGMNRIPSESIDCILTDPPYLYLKNQKLDRPFDEGRFFSEVKRVLKPDGFIVLFGRGVSFYRWNTILADLGFKFKESITWDKGYCTSPLMPISRVHEDISLFTKKSGTINKVKVPYMEMKRHDIDAIITDVKRLRTTFKNTKSLDAVLSFLENNKVQPVGYSGANYVTVSSSIQNADRCASVMKSIQNGMNEKSIIRTGCQEHLSDSITTRAELTKEDRCVSVIQSIQKGMKEKSIIRTDFHKNGTEFKHNVTGSNKSAGGGDRCVNVVQSMQFGMNEKSIIRQSREHYTAIHPTQKPVRLLERLLALTAKEGDTVLDTFAGSCSTAVACINTNRNYICYEIDKEYYDAGVERLKEMKR